MTGTERELPEPVEHEAGDPYGFGPSAGISVGGYFPSGSVPPVSAPAEGAGRTADGGRLFAVAMVLLSWIEHAVPWSSAVPGALASTACDTRARVVDISGSRVIWMPGVLMCRDCAAVVADSRREDGRRSEGGGQRREDGGR
ncbi:hypothetical protein [Sphaerisporangium sp. NPDC051011]|uniref:hypothetical protein n=1 Tax=Sphaerisporangium sp. NPDC051011 TaxID=3155792 RepID=UPI0033CA5689